MRPYSLTHSGLRDEEAAKLREDVLDPTASVVRCSHLFLRSVVPVPLLFAR